MASVSPDLGALYLRHRDTMYLVAASVLREVGRAAEAADVVQDVMLSIMTSPPTGVQSWEAFLVTSAKRKALDRVKSAAVKHAGPELGDQHDGTDGIDIAEDVADALDRQRLAATAWDCLSVLSDRERKAVWMFVALERPRAEIIARQLFRLLQRESKSTSPPTDQLDET